MRLAQQIIETISKDIQEIEDSNCTNNKLIRKECNLIKSRIDSLSKIMKDDEESNSTSAKLLEFRNRLDALTSKQ